MWEELEREPVFVLTGDQDWAPPWALDRQVSIAHEAGVPLHLFVTNDAPLVREPSPGLTLGIHPNFLPGSSHGKDTAQVVEHCMALVPGAKTARMHSYAECTPWLIALARAGIRADSNTCTMLQPGLVPLLQIVGLLRFPVFLEDDVLLRWAGCPPPLDALVEHLHRPGLKLLDFHPSLVGLNARSADDYARRRTALAASQPPPEHGERGVADLMRELLEHLVSTGQRIVAMHDLVARAEELVAAAAPDGTLGWRPGQPW